MSRTRAIEADGAGELEVAAAEYERTLAEGRRELRVLLDLALLYWQATHPGLAANRKKIKKTQRRWRQGAIG